MKKLNILLIILFSLFAPFASAQKSEVRRSVSKEVQKISNKKLLANEQLLTLASAGFVFSTFSKDVQLISNQYRKIKTQNNMVSIGYPVWTISKGVHKIGKPISISNQKPVIPNEPILI